jgi:hypothetical protein
VDATAVATATARFLAMIEVEVLLDKAGNPAVWDDISNVYRRKIGYLV